jgi:hypothetical protein
LAGGQPTRRSARRPVSRTEKAAKISFTLWLLAAIQCVCVGEDLDPHVVGVAVDVGQAASEQVVDEARGVLPEHRDVWHLLDGHDRSREVGGELVIVGEAPAGRGRRSWAWQCFLAD